ncbi:MAG TPA: hypothetical protein VF522_03595 [Ramlibacter sp.]|uniref:hypothetical protein n=1 Tax=Ramlibacter sp. TaxID=1917967 RepID=UPI002ED4F60F
MRVLHLLLATVLAATVLPASAQRLPVPIVNPGNLSAAAAPGRQLKAEDVKKAILAAALATERKWAITEVAPGRMIATYHVRTHTVTSEIHYTAADFSVFYRDSINMKYAPGPDGKGVIHPFYNQWVQELVQAIRIELAKA